MAFRFFKTILLPLVWLFLPFWCAAQSARLESIGADEGLSQGMIYDILQDKHGYLWFGTRDGLNRYDGYTFQVHKNDPFNQFSVSDNIIKVLFEDHLGRIWVGTENNGVDVFDQATGRFFHLSKGTNGLSNQNVISLAQTPDGAMWVGTENGLNRILLPATLPSSISDLTSVAVSEQYFWEKSTNQSALRSDVIQSLVVANDGLLWVGTKQHCYSFDLKTKTQHQIPVQEKEVVRPEARSNRVAMAPDGSIWVGQLNQIVHIRGDITIIYPLPFSKSENYTTLTFDRESNLYVNRRKEIFFYPVAAIDGFEKGINTGTPPSPQIFYQFPQKDVIGSSKIYCDRRGLVWIGTNGYGIRKYNPANRLFKHYLPGVSTRKIRINSAGEQWVWTSSGTFSLLETAAEPSKKHLIQGHNLFEHDCLFDRSGNLWLLAQQKTGAEDNSVLIQRNLRTSAEIQTPNLVSVGIYSQLIEDRQGNIWILGNNSQLVRYDVAKRTAQKFDLSAFTGFKEFGFVMMEDVNDHIWVGTPHGLIRGIPNQANESLSFSLFKNNPSNRRSLNNNAILCLLDDDRDQGRSLWVGTRGGGLNLLNKETGACIHYTPADGLPNDVVYGILQDEQGCLWLSTNSGLSKFNPQTKYFENYSAADGLQDNEFNTTSYAKASNGQMYFGGVNGLTVFDPKLINTVDAPPPVQITAIKIHGKLLAQGQAWKELAANQRWTLTLPYDQNHLTIDFAAMDFSTPNKNQFRYRMQGAHDNWSEASNDHSTTFSNLVPGRYVFEVRTGGAHGIWTGEPATIEITILAPWWKSFLACLVYALFAIWLGWLAYRFQVRRIQLQEQLAFEHREAERVKALEQLKSNFFNNLTHELRTPITLILEPLRQILYKPEAKNWLSKVRIAEANSQKLLLIVNQLLDLAKLEGKAMQVENQLGQVAVVLQSLANTFADNAKNKKIVFLCAPDSVFVPPFKFDADKLEKIATNLLSNAMKFTPQGGNVEMRWFIGREDWFVLEIVNSGPGISAEDLPKIFDRFFSKGNALEHQQTSTGIGLALCRELTELMGGIIEAESVEGTGTTFRLWLPMLAVSEAETVVAPKLLAKKPSEVLTETAHETAGFVADTNGKKERALLLLAEDNQELRHFISVTLQEQYDVLEAADGQEAAELALEHVPDIVVSDLMMPRLDGLGLLNMLKNDVRTSHIPFLMLTAKMELKNRVAGIQQGADAYLGKPFQTEELFAWLRNLLESRRRLQEKYNNKGYGQGVFAVPSEQPGVESSAPEAIIGLLDRQFLEQLKEILSAEIDNSQITPAEIAHRLAMSRSQLHRKLTALTGIAVSAYLRNYRLDRAMELLRDGAGNVSEVAWQVGFVNAKHFSTAFKEKFRKSPSEV